MAKKEIYSSKELKIASAADQDNSLTMDTNPSDPYNSQS